MKYKGEKSIIINAFSANFHIMWQNYKKILKKQYCVDK